MSEPDLETLLRQGITAARASRREQSRQLLLQVTALDERNILAWLWLSTVLDDLEERRICLENVLTLDPGNQHAQLGLARLDQPPPAPAVQPAPAELPSFAAIVGEDASAGPSQTEAQPPSKYHLLDKKAAGQAKPAAPKSTGGDCPFCQHPVPTTATTCSHCQLPLVMKCPTCHTMVDVEQQTCSQCHHQMGNYRRRLTYFAELAAVYQQHQLYAEALRAWQAVETLQPDYPELHLHVGEAQVGLGRLDRATDSFNRVLKQEPRSIAAHFALAELLRQRGEIEEAYPHYLKVAELDPKHGLAWLRLGQLYDQARRRQDAAQAYKRAAALLKTGSAESSLAEQQLAHLRPGLPVAMATGWSELLRQMTGPIFICLLMALLDSGLRPWWISWSGWLALCLAPLGAFLFVSGTSLPRNPLIRLLVGEQGVAAEGWRIPVMILGVFFWLFAMSLILLPLGSQSLPEIPDLPS